MYVNTSSPANASLPPGQRPSLNSSHGSCFIYPPGCSIFTAFTVTNILLLLPLSISVLFFGFRRWRKERGSATVNPIDIFTYHMVAMEMFGISASISCCCGAFIGHQKLVKVACNTFAIISCVKMFFHVLTSVERYLAVVHPIAYLSLSKKDGVMIRNISTGCVWLICSVLITLRLLTSKNFNMILFFFNLVSSLIIVSFCSLSVLRALIRPGPGEGCGNGGKADNSKQRAFITLRAIMAVLLLRFGGNLVCQALAPTLSYRVGCVVQISGIWFCLPSSYVLPLLFLHNEGKLWCFKYNTES